MNLGGRSSAGRDSAVHRAGPTVGIRGLTGEEQRSAKRASQFRGRLRSSHHLVAVRAPRERIVLPVVRPDRIHQTAYAPMSQPELSGQRGDCDLLELFRGQL